MAKEITLMVLQGDDPKGPPRFLLEDRGIWRNMPNYAVAGQLPLPEQQTFVEQSLRELMEQVGDGTLPPAGMSLLPSFRERLYQALVPAPLRLLLTEAAQAAAHGDPPLLRIHLDERLEWIPWEVMRDDAQDFLGVHFQIARLPISVTGPDLSERGSRKVKEIYNLLGKEVLEDDLGLMQDWRQTFAGVNAGNRERRFPANGTVGDWSTNLADAGTAQIMHVTCHGGLLHGVSQERFWTFHLSKSRAPWNRLQPSNLSVLQLGASKPLVFGNACSSAGGGAANLKVDPGALVSGFGPSFFAQGAIAFVGTFAPVSRVLAVKFARRFYDLLLANPPVPIARALWQTKMSFHDANPRERDPSYLFYCLYGPPGTTFELSQE